jgi:hypothetical protein
VAYKQSFPDHFPPEKIWILGAGRFGTIACKRLLNRHAQASFLVIDSREEELARIEERFGLPVQFQEAVSFIGARPLADDVWIIPAGPIHVAFQWLLGRIEKNRSAYSIDVPQAVDDLVPNPFRMNSKTLYASFADFRCPDACSEPDEICTHTGKPRPGNLFEHLQKVKVPGFEMVVVRSWQLAPGVGGYPGAALKGALETVSRKPGRYLLATSCRCHAVVDALGWEKKAG